MTEAIKTVESHVYSLGELFSQKYTVDFYQREYTWQRSHVEDLINDLSTEFLKNWKSGDTYEAVQTYDPYYMGEIVISVKSGKPNAVIDGQQRITTLTLLLIYLLRTYGSHEDFPDDEVKKLIYSNSYGKKLLNLDIEERTECMLALFNGKEYTVKSSDTPSVSNILARYNDFSECWNDELNSQNIISFVYWLMGKVVFSKVWTNDDEFAYVIFETMNDRGLSLTQVEMLRSYLLANINPPQRDKSKIIFDSVVKRLTGIKLSSKTKAEQEFFRIYFRGHYAESMTQSKDANSDFQRIGKEFHRWVRDNAKKLKLESSAEFAAFIDRIDYFAKQYEYINQLIENRDTKKFLYLIVNHDYGITLQTALLLSGIAYGDDKQTVDRKIQVLSKHLTKIVTWRVWCHVQISQSSLEAPIYDLCKTIRGASIPDIEAALEKDVSSYPPLLGTPTLNQQNRRRMSVLLSLITEIVAVGEGAPDYMLNKKEPIEVEHIWADHFDQHTDDCGTENEFSVVRNNVGDLLVLPKAFNASYGDAPYDEKSVHYIEQNVLAQSLCQQKYSHNPGFASYVADSGLAFKAYEHFGRTAIMERAELYRQILLLNWNEDDPADNRSGSTSTWTEADVLAYSSAQTRALYQSLKQHILGLDEKIRVGFTKLYAYFDYDGKRIVCIELQMNSVVIWLNIEPQLLYDPYNMVRDVTNVGHHGVGHSQLKLEDSSHLDKAKKLIAQTFNKQV